MIIHAHFNHVLHYKFLDSLVVRISACHVEGPGSIPGRGDCFSQLCEKLTPRGRICSCWRPLRSAVVGKESPDKSADLVALVRMAERSKALRSGRSPLLWAWVRIPLLTKIFFSFSDLGLVAPAMVGSYLWAVSVVVITSALHAEGREFEPRQNLSFNFLTPHIPGMFLDRQNHCKNGWDTEKICQGATRVELVTSRSAVECSATELYPRLVILLRKIEVNVRCASIDGVCCNLATLESALFSLY